MVAPLVPLSPRKIAEASRSLAAAFFDDPTSRFLLPREQSRDRWLRLIHQASLRHLLPEGHVHTIEGDGVSGVIGLVSPGRYPLPTVRFLRPIIPIVLRLPPGGFSPRRGPAPFCGLGGSSPACTSRPPAGREPCWACSRSGRERAWDAPCWTRRWREPTVTACPPTWRPPTSATSRSTAASASRSRRRGASRAAARR